MHFKLSSCILSAEYVIHWKQKRWGELGSHIGADEQCEICEMWNLRFNRASMPFKPAQGHRLQVNISSLMFYGEMTKPFQLL